jgi:hypothetical protein
LLTGLLLLLVPFVGWLIILGRCCSLFLQQGRFSEQLKQTEITKTLRQLQKRLSNDLENSRGPI